MKKILKKLVFLPIMAFIFLSSFFITTQSANARGFIDNFSTCNRRMENGQFCLHEYDNHTEYCWIKDGRAIGCVQHPFQYNSQCVHYFTLDPNRSVSNEDRAALNPQCTRNTGYGVSNNVPTCNASMSGGTFCKYARSGTYQYCWVQKAGTNVYIGCVANAVANHDTCESYTVLAGSNTEVPNTAFLDTNYCKPRSGTGTGDGSGGNNGSGSNGSGSNGSDSNGSGSNGSGSNGSGSNGSGSNGSGSNGSGSNGSGSNGSGSSTPIITSNPTPSTPATGYTSSPCRYFLGLSSWDCNVPNIDDEDSLKAGVWIIASNIFTDITIIAAYLIIGYVIYGGYLYTMSSGDPGKIATGKKTLLNGFIGLGIVMLANIILNSIRVALGANFAADCLASESACTSPEDLVTNAIHWVTAVVGVVSVAFVIYGGVSYMTSTGDPGKVKKAKDMILYALIGLAIVGLAEIITAFVSGAIRNAGESSYINNTTIAKEVHEKDQYH